MSAALRELLEDVLGNLLGEEAIVWVETTTDGKYAEKMHALCNKARESIATLTQQQGGEQEAGDVVLACLQKISDFCPPDPTANQLDDSPEMLVRLHNAEIGDTARAGLAALRTKQAAASEGDGCAMCSRWQAVAKAAQVGQTVAEKRVERTKADAALGAEVDVWVCMNTHFTGEPPYVGNPGIMLALKELKAELDTLRNTSKQAAGEAVTSDCTEPNRVLCPRLCADFCNAAEMRKVILRDTFEAWLEGTSGYKTCKQRGKPMSLRTHMDGSYADFRVNDRWIAWKAALNNNN